MKKYCFGIDVGGTTIKLGLFDVEGTILDKWEIVTNTADCGKRILPDVANAILSKMEERGISKEDIAGAGIGVPGPVDSDGIILTAVNLGWGVTNINHEVSSLTGLKVQAGNDANMAALGEMWQGSGSGHTNLVFATLGTGVGGGIIVDEKIMTGAIGVAGEIGHMHVEYNENESCNCGNKGCLEQYASATGVVRLANRMMKATDKPSVLRDGEISAKAVFDAVKAGDELAMEIAEQFGEYLGKALANVAAICNPEIFVLGGGVSKAGDVLIGYIKKYFKAYAFHGIKDTEFALASLGNDAGIYGAARMVLE